MSSVPYEETMRSLLSELRCPDCAMQCKSEIDALLHCARVGTDNEFEHGCCYERCGDPFCSSDGRGGNVRVEVEHDPGDEDKVP